MSNRSGRNHKTELGGVCSSIDFASAVLRAIEDLGVTRDQLSRLISDQDFATRVAQLMREDNPPTPAIQAMTFDRLMEIATDPTHKHRLAEITFLFEPKNRQGWTTFGDRVRGPLRVVDMQRDWDESDLREFLGHETTRLHLSGELDLTRTLKPATAYELLNYAAFGWDGHTYLAAYGSVITRSSDNSRRVPWLWTYAKGGELQDGPADPKWRRSHANSTTHPLCVEV